MKVLYGNVDVFSGANSPAPLVSRTVETIAFGARWGQLHKITLQNVLTGRCLTYQQIVNNQQLLLSGFRQDFQTLNIISDSGTVVSYPLAEVESINFEDSTYASDIFGYSIQLNCYPSGFFSGQFGVTNPVNEFNFEESDDGIVNINHRVAAQGFNTYSGNPSNALENARIWAQSRTGWNNQVLPALISGFNSGSACLRLLEENYDRLNGTYEVRERYVADSYLNNNGGLLRYTISLESGIEEGITTATVNGNIQGCKFDSISGARNRYSAFNAFNTANNALLKYAGRNDLNQTPVSKTVSEDQKRNILDFNYVFNDDLKPKIYIITEIEFNFDSLNDIIGATVTCTVKSKGQYNLTKWNDVLAVANQINLYSLAQAAYPSYSTEIAPHLTVFPLNPNAISTSRSEDEYNTTVVLQASFDNKEIPPNDLKVYDYNIQITPGLHKYSAYPILDGNGNYYLFDLGFVTRGNIQLNLQAIGKETSSAAAIESFLKLEALRLQNTYFPGIKKVLEQQQLNKSTASFDKERSLTAAYSAEQTEFTL